ncbi:hypothetical protein [Isoptericola sp. NPDC057191]|uniref:hypothetical protein n=1 Tax=Isoptericola sp. NPDC057191 TaxID=3346041 RepID=UPI0036421C69
MTGELLIAVGAAGVVVTYSGTGWPRGIRVLTVLVAVLAALLLAGSAHRGAGSWGTGSWVTGWGTGSWETWSWLPLALYVSLVLVGVPLVRVVGRRAGTRARRRH